MSTANSSVSTQLEELIDDQVYIDTLAHELSVLTQEFILNIDRLRSAFSQAAPDQKKLILGEIMNLNAKFSQHIDYIRQIA